MAGMVHPLFRTAMLPNELLNKARKNIQLRVGDLIPFKKLRTFEHNYEMSEYLRLHTYLLEFNRIRKEYRGFTSSPRLKKENWGDFIMSPRNTDMMGEELRRLAPSQTLVDSGGQVVIQATADQIPNILLEIGRLREITFRAVGKGTGKSVDIDRFDHTYIHLFSWNPANQEVVGACRLGRTGAIVKKHGLKGLYTSTLFQYTPEFIERLGTSLEMSRSFIRLEYQKSYAPLLLLWKGIGRFIVDNPHYKTLFGPVSITDGYRALSRELIIKSLQLTRYHDGKTGLVKARKSLKSKPLRGWDVDAARRIIKDDIEDISELISSIESDHKGIPILLKQYLKLGGKIAGVDVDPALGNVLDGLIIVDLTKTKQRMLDRYMGKEGAELFMTHQEALKRDRYATYA